LLRVVVDIDAGLQLVRAVEPAALRDREPRGATILRIVGDRAGPSGRVDSDSVGQFVMFGYGSALPGVRGTAHGRALDSPPSADHT
jgi:hypothetical protein